MRNDQHLSRLAVESYLTGQTQWPAYFPVRERKRYIPIAGESERQEKQMTAADITSKTHAQTLKLKHREKDNQRAILSLCPTLSASLSVLLFPCLYANLAPSFTLSNPMFAWVLTTIFEDPTLLVRTPDKEGMSKSCPTSYVCYWRIIRKNMSFVCCCDVALAKSSQRPMH